MFHEGDETVSFTAPEYTNSLNTMRYWKDRKLGKIYYPGETYTINTSEIEIDPEYGPVGWSAGALWEGDTLAVDETARIDFYQSDDPANNADDNDGVNYYTYWQAVSQQVVGTYSISASTFTLNQGQNTITIPSDYSPTYNGQSLVCWNTRMDGSGTSYQPGDVVVMNSLSLSLYSIYSSTRKNVVNVIGTEELMCHGGTSGISTATFSYDENGLIPEFTPPAALVNELAEFDCWVDGLTGKEYYPGQTYYNVDVKPHMAAQDNVLENGTYWTQKVQMELYAKWKSDTIYFNHEVMLFFEFEGGGSDYFVTTLKGTYNFDTMETTFDGNHSLVIPADRTPESDRHHTFSGWCEDMTGAGRIYQNGETYEFTNPYSLSLYAVYDYNGSNMVVEDLDQTVTVQEIEPENGIQLVLQGTGTEVDLDDITMRISAIDDDAQAQYAEDLQEQFGVQLNTDDEGKITNWAPMEIHMITVVDNRETPVQVDEGCNAAFKFTIAYPDIENPQDYEYHIYHYLESEGRYEVINVSHAPDGSGLVFYMSSFSPVILTWEEASDEPSDEPEDTRTPEERQEDADRAAALIDEVLDQKIIDELIAATNAAKDLSENATKEEKQAALDALDAALAKAEEMMNTAVDILYENGGYSEEFEATDAGKRMDQVESLTSDAYYLSWSIGYELSDEVPNKEWVEEALAEALACAKSAEEYLKAAETSQNADDIKENLMRAYDEAQAVASCAEYVELSLKKDATLLTDAQKKSLDEAKAKAKAIEQKVVALMGEKFPASMVVGYATDKNGHMYNVTLDEVQISAVELKDAKAYIEALKADAKDVLAYDVKVVTKEGGYPVTLNDSGYQFPVSLIMPTLKDGQKAVLYHFVGGSVDKKEEVAFESKDGKAAFTSESFSPFLFVVITVSSGGSGNSPATGEMSLLPIIIVAISALLIGAGVIVYRKRKAVK